VVGADQPLDEVEAEVEVLLPVRQRRRTGARLGDCGPHLVD
jgi:hypothetical protein